MTQDKKRRAGSEIFGAICSVMLLAGALYLSLFFSDDTSEAVADALKLCSAVIIPSVFPFMILSDFLAFSVSFDTMKRPSRIFERIFRIKGAGLCAFAMGAICGFPLGVKCASELYMNGQISRAEAEKLIGFSNNTGPAFIVSGIGIGLRGSALDGILLYFSMIASAVITGIIFPTGNDTYERQKTQASVRARFDIISSVKNAALGTIYICAFLTFFAPICALVRMALGDGLPYLLALPLFEVGNAVNSISASPLLSDLGSLMLCGFAISFSGLSVHLQAMSFVKGTDIRIGKYFLMKLTQGFVSVILLYALFPLIR